LLQNVDDEDLKDVNLLGLPFCPTNTQSVERMIALMSKVACNTDAPKRDGASQLTLESLNAMPAFSSKQDFATRQLNM